MPRSSTTKTWVACRPGTLQQFQSAFAEMDVRVVEDLEAGLDYEFRQEEMTGMDLVMAELESEERMQADPKHAHTFIVPLVAGDLANDDLLNVPWLAIRTQDDVSMFTVDSALQKVKLQQAFDGEVEVTATISEIRQVLKDEGVNVLSISEAEGLTRLAE